MKKKMFLGRWLLVVMLLSSSPSIGRLKSTPTPICNFKSVFLPLLLQFDYFSVPIGLQSCGVPSFFSNPNTQSGVSSLNQLYFGYFCKITIESTNTGCDGRFVREYYWTRPQSSMDIEVPSNYPFRVRIDFYEKCYTCLSEPKFHSKVYVYQNNFNSAPANIIAVLKYARTHFCA